ncbi:MAG: WecB/TagA/CpsF family glycosyltransferase [Acidimicrobiales bacterium]
MTDQDAVTEQHPASERRGESHAGASAGVIERLNVFGIGVSKTTYAEAADAIVAAGKRHQSFGMTALAVHGLIEAVTNDEFGALINERFDLVTPDGMPVKWAMNLLHRAGLESRVAGPEVIWHVFERAEREGVSIFLYGSTGETCRLFAEAITNRHPNLLIAGIQPDRFRDATPEEDLADIEVIHDSGAGIVLVGRGCPRQERWVADHRGKVDAAMMAVGAAFDFGAGLKSRPPTLIQRLGLEWAWRLAAEPKRLWRRYLSTNSRFLALLTTAMVRRASGSTVPVIPTPAPLEGLTARNGAGSSLPTRAVPNPPVSSDNTTTVTAP